MMFSPSNNFLNNTLQQLGIAIHLKAEVVVFHTNVVGYTMTMTMFMGSGDRLDNSASD